MATRKQKQDLIEALKFVPHSVEVYLSGYGGEIVMGTVDRATYDYWSQRDPEELADFAYGYDEETTVPEPYQFVSTGNWYDCDDLAHYSGVELSSYCSITVRDAETNTVLFESALDPATLQGHGIEIEALESYQVDDTSPGTAVFVGQSVEKGSFYRGVMQLSQPFDPKKLQLSYVTVHDWNIVTGIDYPDELEDMYDYSTMGKSSSFEMFLNEADQDLDDLDPWNTAERDLSRATEWFLFREHVPFYEGEYQVQVASTLYPEQFAVWRNQKWQYNNGESVVLPIVAWRGVSYSTV
jgi:hypothetical protein